MQCLASLSPFFHSQHFFYFYFLISSLWWLEHYWKGCKILGWKWRPSTRSLWKWAFSQRGGGGGRKQGCSSLNKSNASIILTKESSFVDVHRTFCYPTSPILNVLLGYSRFQHLDLLLLQLQYDIFTFLCCEV